MNVEDPPTIRQPVLEYERLHVIRPDPRQLWMVYWVLVLICVILGTVLGIMMHSGSLWDRFSLVLVLPPAVFIVFFLWRILLFKQSWVITRTGLEVWRGSRMRKRIDWIDVRNVEAGPIGAHIHSRRGLVTISPVPRGESQFVADAWHGWKSGQVQAKLS